MWSYILLLPRYTEQIIVEPRFTDTYIVITDIFPCPRSKQALKFSQTLSTDVFYGPSVSVSTKFDCIIFRKKSE